MSKNRKYNRSIQLPRKIQGEINSAKALCSIIYHAMKREIIVGTSQGTMNQTAVRERIMQAKKDFDRKLPHGGPKSGFQLARLAYFRALDMMLAKVGGPVNSADDLFDEAIKNEIRAEGPDEASINEAMRMLGMLPPEGSGPASAPAAVGDAALGHAPDTAPQPRFRRTYDAPPTDEGPAGASSGTPDRPDSPAA